MAIRIITNNRPRALIYGYELSDKEKSEFDYMEDLEYETFVRYQGMTFAVGDFMRLSDDCEESKAGWQGVYGLNAFCGVLVKLVGNDRVIVGKVLC
jgi:hypothetical protein